MQLQLTAKLIQILPLETGTGRNGNWKKQNIVVETSDQYPKKICVSVWGDKINSALQLGDQLKIDFDIESREYNGRWYTDIKAWKIEPATALNPAATSQPFTPPPLSPEDIPSDLYGSFPEVSNNTDLPF
jgi:hypothetical protein